MDGYTESQIRAFARDEIEKWAKQERKELKDSFKKNAGDEMGPFPPCIDYLKSKQ